MTIYPQEFLDLLASVTAKRPKTVIDHILAHGQITSEELKSIYGYNHPPRAARDVRELGIPLITHTVKGTDGRRIAVYTFGNPEDINKRNTKSSGRTLLSKALKQALLEAYGPKCAIYLETIDTAELQVDHRVPYEIGGEHPDTAIEHYMLLSPSANRTKSWTCEHCENWTRKDYNFCMTCFWAHPEKYTHVAGKYEKIVILLFTDNEIEDYYRLIELSGESTAQETLKTLLHAFLNTEQ